MHETAWWERRWFLAAIVLLSMAPLLLPDTPPLVDVPGHLARHRVQLDWASSPELQQYFTFHWVFLGNLGADLLLEFLAPVFGLEPAFKIIVLAIPPLTVLGMLLVVREVHGRIPPTTLFAVPLVYSYPFNFGFINFSLAAALALLAFAGWLRLTHQRRFKLRAGIFVPASCALWVVHVFGWGVLGLLAISAETVRHRDEGKTWPRSVFQASIDTSILAVPILFMIVWRSSAPEGGFGQIIPIWKFYALISAMRDRWVVWDAFSVAAILILIGSAIFDRHLELSRKLAIPAVALLVAFLLIPFAVFGSAYADMRLAPLMLITAIIAIRQRTDSFASDNRIALLGAAFIALRLGGNVVSFAQADLEARERLRALDNVRGGAAVLTLVRKDCGDDWALPRHAHFGGFVIARKRGFANEQWQLPGSHLLNINYDKAGDFQDDYSKDVFSRKCLKQFAELNATRKSRKPKNPRKGKPMRPPTTTEQTLLQFPRGAFDYVWLIEPPDFDMEARPGLVPIWRGRDSVLYRIEKAPKVPTAGASGH
jgi:hypothetical protein